MFSSWRRQRKPRGNPTFISFSHCARYERDRHAHSCDLKLRAQERRADFSDQFLGGVGRRSVCRTCDRACVSRRVSSWTSVRNSLRLRDSVSVPQNISSGGIWIRSVEGR